MAYHIVCLDMFFESVKILSSDSVASFMFCHTLSLEILKVSVSYLLREDIGVHFAE